MKTIHSYYHEAKEALLKIPGVRTVGIGLKEEKGELVGQIAFRVYVVKKKPTESLREDEIIPKMLFGFPTDVLNEVEIKELCGATRPLIGGIAVSTWDMPFVSPPGSIGCIVEREGTEQKFILSNEHVLGALETERGRVFQPTVSDSLGFICNEVGVNIQGVEENVSYNNGLGSEQYYVDCAIASVNSDIGVRNSVKEVSDPLNGDEDISRLDTNNITDYVVKKSGSTTGLTIGIVEDVVKDFIIDPDHPEDIEYRTILIRPNPGKLISETYEISVSDKASILSAFASEPLVNVIDIGDNRLKFESRVFCAPGDSGSVILNNQNKVVGLLFLGTVKTITAIVNGVIERRNINTGKAVACHIRPVMEQLQVKIGAGTFATSGTYVLVPENGAEAGDMQQTEHLHASLARLEEELSTYQRGRDFLSAIKRHFPELAQLVHHKRSVKFTWHKYKGPAFSVILLKALNDSSSDFQKVYEGVPLMILLKKMYEILRAEGSSALVKSLDQWSGSIMHLASSRSMNEGLDILNNRNSGHFHLYSGGTRPLTGGIQCRRHPDDNQRPKPGTLGYIATKISNGEQVLLSCEHVLLYHRRDSTLVFQPDYSKCTGIYYNEVGNVANGIVGNHPVSPGSDLFFIDAAYASVESGVATKRFIPNVGNITGAESIIGAPITPQIRLKKMGAASGYTEGVVTRVDLPFHGAANLIKLNPLAGHTFTYRERRKVDPTWVADVLIDFPNEAFQGTATLVDPVENIIEFQSEVFAIPGDSGAMLVNDNGKIVGMIVSGDMFEVRAFDPDEQRWRIAGIPKGPALACHIQPILHNLGLRIDPSSNTTSGNPIVVPGNLVVSENPDKYTMLSEKLAQLEKEFQATEQGRRFISLIQSCFKEVIQLVHHTRPVKVIWHRYNGPAFIAAFFRCISKPDTFLPKEVDGIPVSMLLQRMDHAFSQNGSSTLYKVLEEHREWIYQLVNSSQTINELLLNLKTKYTT